MRSYSDGMKCGETRVWFRRGSRRFRRDRLRSLAENGSGSDLTWVHVLVRETIRWATDAPEGEARQLAWPCSGELEALDQRGQPSVLGLPLAMS